MIFQIAIYLFLMSLYVLAAFAIYRFSPYFKKLVDGEIALARGGATRLELTGLRGVLALSVFIHHVAVTFFYFQTGLWREPPMRIFALLGPYPVTLFFFLTGFLFWSKIQKEGISDKVKFFKARALRILPGYFFSMLLVFGIVAMKSHFEIRSSLFDLAQSVSSWLFFGLPFYKFSDINGLVDSYIVNAGVAWSLGFEVLFYVALIGFLPLRKGRRVLLLFFATTLVSFCSLENLGPVAVFFARFIKFMAVGFNFGMFAAYIGVSASAKVRAFFKAPLGNVLVAVCLLCAAALYKDSYRLVQSALLFPLFLSVSFGNSFRGILTCRPLVLLGSVSYSIYVLHGIALYCMSNLANGFFAVSRLSQLQFFISFGGLGGIGICVLGAASFYFIEAPFLKSYRDRIPLFGNSASIVGEGQNLQTGS